MLNRRPGKLGPRWPGRINGKNLVSRGGYVRRDERPWLVLDGRENRWSSVAPRRFTCECGMFLQLQAVKRAKMAYVLEKEEVERAVDHLTVMDHHHWWLKCRVVGLFAQLWSMTVPGILDRNVSSCRTTSPRWGHLRTWSATVRASPKSLGGPPASHANTWSDLTRAPWSGRALSHLLFELGVCRA